MDQLKDSGIKRFMLPDTLGVMSPEEVFESLSDMRRRYPDRVSGRPAGAALVLGVQYSFEEELEERIVARGCAGLAERLVAAVRIRFIGWAFRIAVTIAPAALPPGLAEQLAGLDDGRTLFVFSSDFAHYGSRFGYAPFGALSPLMVKALMSSSVWKLSAHLNSMSMA